jgi:hypothetical protein
VHGFDSRTRCGFYQPKTGTQDPRCQFVATRPAPFCEEQCSAFPLRNCNSRRHDNASGFSKNKCSIRAAWRKTFRPPSGVCGRWCITASCRAYESVIGRSCSSLKRSTRRSKNSKSGRCPAPQAKAMELLPYRERERNGAPEAKRLLGREPPHSDEAEKGAHGPMLTAPHEAIPKCATRVRRFSHSFRAIDRQSAPEARASVRVLDGQRQSS